MEKDFIPYEQALDLEELGFDDYCLGLYSYASKNTVDMQHVIHTCKASSKVSWMRVPTPTFSQAFRWFREKYGYDVTIKKCTPSEYKFEIEQLFVEGNNYYFIDFSFDTYEEAEVACLRKLIEIVKRK